MEGAVAEYARTMKKPIAASIAGAPPPRPGKKMGHAGRHPVDGRDGSHAGKKAALEVAGAPPFARRRTMSPSRSKAAAGVSRPRSARHQALGETISAYPMPFGCSAVAGQRLRQALRRPNRSGRGEPACRGWRTPSIIARTDDADAGARAEPTDQLRARSLTRLVLLAESAVGSSHPADLARADDGDGWRRHRVHRRRFRREDHLAAAVFVRLR